MHKLKLTKLQIEEKGRAILRYMQGGEFKTCMQNSAQKAEEVYGLMVEEIDGHRKTWQKRHKIYCTIHNNIQNVRLEIGKIVTGNPLLTNEFGMFPELPESLK